MHDKYGLLAMVMGSALVLAACDSGDDDDDNAAEVGDGDGDGDPGDGDGDPTTGSDSNGDFGGEGGELTGCALNDNAADCMAEAGCTPVLGMPLIDDGGGNWCTVVTEEFIGCTSTNDLCPPLGKTLCDGENYWRTTACVPDNVAVCDNPGEITGDC